MQSIKQPEEFNLKNIFVGCEYIIPIYQRSYAWGKVEIEQLLTDIYDSKGRYYLGSLIVDEEAPNTFSVIDGQQRLTTLFLLLSFLKDETLSKTTLRFEAREKSTITLADLYEKQELKKDDFYSKEIVAGYEIIKNFFVAIESRDNNSNYREKFKAKLPNILIIRIQVPKQIDFNHYFEIMNTRGEQLEIHEIAKGRILSVIAKESPEYRSIAALIWDKCSQMDSYIQMNFDKASRQRIFGNDWDCFCCKDIEDVKDKMSIKNEVRENEFSLLDILSKKSTSIDVDNDSKTDDDNDRFESIVSFPNFLLIVNETMQNSANEEDDSTLDDKKFIETLKKHWDNGETALQYIYSLLKCRFLFDKYIIKREFARDYKEDGRWSLQKLQKYTDQNEKEKPSYKLTYAYDETERDNRTETLRSLQSALRITYTSPKTMHWISKVLASLMENEEVNLTVLLEKYACGKIKSANIKEARGFGIDRIVFTYLDYVLDRDSISKISNYQFQFRTSIEHFYPQNPIEKPKWPNSPLNSFGNLALITVSSNSKFSNLDPQSKVASYPDTILQSPKLKLMSDIMKQNNNVWDESLAVEHGKEMLELLEKEISRFSL